MKLKDNVTLHFGRVSALRVADCTVRVRLDELQAVETFWLPVGQWRAGAASTAYWMPEIDELVLVALDGGGSQGCVLAGIYSQSSPPPAAALGLLAIAVPTLTVDGNVEINGNISIAGNVDISGAVAVTGSHNINGKDTVVVGSVDSGGDIADQSGQ